MIRNNTNSILKPFVGNYHPFNLYRGYTKIAGYTIETETGTNAVELQNTYKEPLKSKIYGNGNQNITQTGDNVFNGELESGNYNYNDGTKEDSTTRVRSKDYIDITGATTITVVSEVAFNDTQSLGIRFYDENKNYVGYSSSSNFTKERFTTVNPNLSAGATIKYCNIALSITNTTVKIAVNKGKNYNYTEFVPYSPSPDYPSEIISVGDLVTEGEHEGKYIIILQNEGLSTSKLQTTTIYLDAPLRAIEVSNTDNYNITQIIDGVTHYYIADYVDYGRKKVVRNIGEIVLNELLTYARYPTNITGQYRFRTNISNCYSTSSVIYYLGLISNKLKSICRQDGYSGVEGISYLPETGYAGPGLMLYIDECKTLTVEKFKTYLSTNPITVDYILATPVEEDITIEDINVIPNYCKVSVEVEQEPLALEVEYAKMEVE